MMTQTVAGYSSPEIEIAHIVVESGFASTYPGSTLINDGELSIDPTDI